MINVTQRKQMATGTTLVARYKGEAHECTVTENEEGKLLYRLADGRAFKSPSAAGSAVMGGTACNGWRFWSLSGGEPEFETTVEPESTHEPEAPSRGIGRQHGCEACGKRFMSLSQLEHHRANAERLCRPA